MNLSNATLKEIDTFTADLLPTMIGVRRELHQHPERSGQESWTSAYLAQLLDFLGLPVRRHVGGFGLVADLVVDPSAPTLAFRVDMDALPLEEINAVAYRSRAAGLMHACGHDVHSAIGFGTAAVLTHFRHLLSHNIRFIFQPEEEEITGALRMIRAGVLTRPVPDAIFGLHVAPLPAGRWAYSHGLFLSGFDHYLVTIRPDERSSSRSADAHAVAERCCQAILQFNQFILPETWDEMQAFWKIMADGSEDIQRFVVYDASTNPDEPDAWHGQMGLGIKAATPHLRRSAIGRVRAMLTAICRATHTRYQVKRVASMPDLINNARLVEHTLPILTRALGADNLVHLQGAFPFNCEDFAYFTEHIPGAMFWLGAADASAGKYAMLHTPDFDVDERCMHTGTVAIASILLDF